jgi:hypothetical protein
MSASDGPQERQGRGVEEGGEAGIGQRLRPKGAGGADELDGVAVADAPDRDQVDERGQGGQERVQPAAGAVESGGEVGLRAGGAVAEAVVTELDHGVEDGAPVVGPERQRRSRSLDQGR